MAKMSRRRADRLLVGDSAAPRDPPTVLAAQITAYCRSKGWPDPLPEYRFHADRGWLFDFAWPGLKVAVEYEGLMGGLGGRHQRRAGYAEDARKYTEAALLGWTVIRVTAATLGELWGWLDRAMRAGIPHAEVSQ